MELDVLDKFAEELYQVAKEHGFHDETQPDMPRYIANLHCELSELFEAYRKSELNKLCDKSEKMKELGLEPLTCAEEEVADIIIRILDTAKSLNVNIAKAVKNKHEYNKTRSYRHGGKLS
jgi:NTP pyrophosphatase (non-canonical NTP hydrolase)